MRIVSIILGSCLTAAVPAVAIAQAPPSPATPPAQTAPPNPQRTTNCTPAHSNRDGAKPGETTGQGSEPLGDKLAKSDGVLCPPPGVDPQMHAPAPDTGSMPVIPPPGSPGGDQSIRPK